MFEERHLVTKKIIHMLSSTLNTAVESAAEAKDVGKESKEMLPWGFKDFLYSFLYMLCRVDGLILLFESDGKLKSN